MSEERAAKVAELKDSIEAAARERIVDSIVELLKKSAASDWSVGSIGRQLFLKYASVARYCRESDRLVLDDSTGTKPGGWFVRLKDCVRCPRCRLSFETETETGFACALCQMTFESEEVIREE